MKMPSATVAPPVSSRAEPTFDIKIPPAEVVMVGFAAVVLALRVIVVPLTAVMNVSAAIPDPNTIWPTP